MAKVGYDTAGTTFAHDVVAYDPEDGEIIATLAGVAVGVGISPVDDIADIVNPGSATAAAVAGVVNDILQALRDAGILS